MREGIKLADVQRDFLKFTAQQIKFDLQQQHPTVLEKFKVAVKNRSYQIWENRPLSVPLRFRGIFEQKLEYIHLNPVQEKWRLAELPEHYYYSCARYYILQIDEQGFIKHQAD